MGEPTPTLEQNAYQGLKEYIAISLYLWLVFSLFVLYRAVLIPQSFSDLEQQSPENAAVFCMDEKTAIQALDRTQPALPMRPHQPERQTVEYVRHGTVTLFAALEVHSGKVVGRCEPRHTSEEFVSFLDEAVAGHRRKAIHVILDNLAVHKTAVVQAWTK